MLIDWLVPKGQLGSILSTQWVLVQTMLSLFQANWQAGKVWQNYTDCSGIHFKGNWSLNFKLT